LQEETNEKTIALYIKTGKLTAQQLQKAMKALLAQMKKQHDKQKIPHGKQTLKQLMKQNAGVSNIEITKDNIKAFESTAKKYGIPAYSLPRKNGQRRNWKLTSKNRKKPLTDWTQQRQLSQSKRNWLRSAPLTKPQERQRPACTLRNRKSRYPAAKPTATRYPAPRRKRVFLFTTKSTASRKTIPARRARTNRRNLPSAAQGTGQGNSNRATAAIS